MVRRRSLTLLLIFITTVLSIGLAVGGSWEGFLALNFLTGLFTVAPQVGSEYKINTHTPRQEADFGIGYDSASCGPVSSEPTRAVHGNRLVRSSDGYSDSSSAVRYHRSSKAMARARLAIQ